MTELWLAAGLMMALGASAGFLAGLFGIGGGAVLVPGIYYLLVHFGYEAHAMHIAVGTSLSTIVFTGISSALAHHRRGALSLDLFRLLFPGVLIGVGLGTFIASIIEVNGLKIIFAGSQVFFGTYMLIRGNKAALFQSMPSRPIAFLIEMAIGCLASLKGVGGGVQNVLFMTLCNVPMTRAIATASALGVFIAGSGAMGYMLIGHQADHLPPYSFGYVNLIGFGLIVSMSVFFAPLGARVAHYLPVPTLKKYFSIFMLLIAVKMIVEVVKG